MPRMKAFYSTSPWPGVTPRYCRARQSVLVKKQVVRARSHILKTTWIDLQHLLPVTIEFRVHPQAETENRKPGVRLKSLLPGQSCALETIGVGQGRLRLRAAGLNRWY